MNYQRIYNQLIERAKTRVIEGYFERHHILPRCLGGSDDLENLVVLTPEEHFVAHVLLVKIYPNDHKLLLSVNCMIRGRKGLLKLKHRKMYGWLRRKRFQQMKERWSNPEYRERMIESRKEFWSQPQYREKISEARSQQMRNTWNDPTYRKNMSEKLSGKQRSFESKHKMSVSHIGSVNSQYGTMWITNGIDNKKISKDVPIPDGWNKGRVIKRSLNV